MAVLIFERKAVGFDVLTLRIQEGCHSGVEQLAEQIVSRLQISDVGKNKDKEASNMSQ